MNNDLMFATGNDDTGTPVAFFKRLDDVFSFTHDMAASQLNTKVNQYFGPGHEEPERRDCLSIEWPTGGWLWLNPPYSEPEHACKKNCKKKGCAKRGHCVYAYRPGCIDFVRKASEERKRGVNTVLLLAARTDTAWFHDFVWDMETNGPRQGVEIQFVRGRLKFEGHKDSAPFPSLVVVFHATV